MAAHLAKTDTVHIEDEEKKGAYEHHGMTGFDTTEDQLPPGYFRSS